MLKKRIIPKNSANSPKAAAARKRRLKSGVKRGTLQQGGGNQHG